jgi:hypothetical protein
MRNLMAIFLSVASLGLAACAADGPSDGAAYRNELTGQVCTPNGTQGPLPGQKGQHGNGGHNSPTGIPGDNLDDPHSGKIDCYYDGNSGQGDDKKHPCAPGCDNQHCCVDVDGGAPQPGDDGNGGGGGGGGSDIDAGPGTV